MSSVGSDSSPSSQSTPVKRAPTPKSPTGTEIPNRVFVGGIAAHMTELELFTLFSKFGNVRTARIIQDRDGTSKGYGFVTYETEAEAKRVQDDMPSVYFRERRLNIAAAVKKQQSASRPGSSAASGGEQTTGPSMRSGGVHRSQVHVTSQVRPYHHNVYHQPPPHRHQPHQPSWNSQPQPDVIPQQALPLQYCDPTTPAGWTHQTLPPYTPGMSAPLPTGANNPYCYTYAVAMPGGHVIMTQPSTLLPPGGEYFVTPQQGFYMQPQMPYTPEPCKRHEGGWKLISVPGRC